MDWLYDHWWIVNLIPFLAINAWFVYVFERDEGKFTRSELTLKIVLYAMGLLVVIALLVTFFVGDLLDAAESYLEGHRLPPSQMKRAIKKGLKEGLWAFARAVLTTAILLVFMTLLTSLTSYRPSRIGTIAELVFLFVASEAAMYLRRRGRHD